PGTLVLGDNPGLAVLPHQETPLPVAEPLGALPEPLAYPPVVALIPGLVSLPHQPGVTRVFGQGTLDLFLPGNLAVTVPTDGADPRGERHETPQPRLDRLTAGPLPGPLEAPGLAGSDRPTIEITLRILGQGGGRRVAPPGVLLQALQANRLQVAVDASVP